jgi:AraC-like DNA-binding protein
VNKDRPVFGTTSVRVQLAAFGRMALNVPRITAEAGLVEDDLRDPDAVIQASEVRKAWELADREWARPGLGLHAAGHVPFGACEVMDYLMASSGTVGEAVSQLAEYLAVLTRTTWYQIREGRSEMSCEMVWRIPPHGVMFQMRDFSLALAVGRVFHISGVRPVRVELVGPPVAISREYVNAFGARTVTRAERNALVFSCDGWNANLPAQDAVLNRMLRRHAQLLLDRQPAGGRSLVSEQVRAELLRSSHVGLATIDRIAAGLGMTPRTLQRRLQLEGLRFEDLGQEVRANLAQAYLDDRELSISEVAYLIGFSESSAFSRAFRRWTGRSPQEFRHRAAGGG